MNPMTLDGRGSALSHPLREGGERRRLSHHFPHSVTLSSLRPLLHSFNSGPDGFFMCVFDGRNLVRVVGIPDHKNESDYRRKAISTALLVLLVTPSMPYASPLIRRGHDYPEGDNKMR